MKESVTYQAILEEGEETGRIKEARRAVYRVGIRRFGPITEHGDVFLNGINSLERLEALLDKVFEVETWDELLT